MVSQRDMGIGFGFWISVFKALTGVAKPRLLVTKDFIVMIPCTRPSRSRSGPPLLPRSNGMAS